ncbi:MAG: universal stress protein [Caldimicrobium sp.]|nr:universal stress protein [Caldimicrobium sp.]MCX7613528.1 universal stress protein [Caldimicrobium sp.]MDW8182548.1 universal stress protein [Caldimicrobium sp.]
MDKISKILVPVDFSEVSPVVTKWAKDLAKQVGAHIIVAYVLEDLSTYEGIYVDVKTLTELENTLLEGARKSMDDFLKEHFYDYPQVQSIIEKGDVVETLIRIGEEQGVDLIVMGTHGRKGLDKILFGSVAEGVVKNSPIPVVTINPYRAGLIKAEEE